MLKPNLVETDVGAIHINTHPAVIYGAAQAFLRLGAKEVIVAEGPGHCRDTLLLLEESGLAEMLWQDRIPFVDLNYDSGYFAPNVGGYSSLPRLTFPETLRRADWVVSMAKLKTHHWAGVTLSMKNLFGVMPGMYYGWPKNVLHYAGIDASILDIVSALKPQFAIVDGIVGMEGDGPIMGTPKPAGVLVMGRSLPAVDATCARVMGIDPHQVRYLAEAGRYLGAVHASEIVQVGETGGLRPDEFSAPGQDPGPPGPPLVARPSPDLTLAPRELSVYLTSHRGSQMLHFGTLAGDRRDLDLPAVVADDLVHLGQTHAGAVRF